MLKPVPDIKLSLTEGYAKTIAKGFDGFKEVFNLPFPPSIADTFEHARLAAMEMGGSYQQSPLTVEFGGEEFQIWPYGNGGARWVLMNDDMRLFFRSPETDWNVSVEYTSQGLWGSGIHKLRQRAVDVLIRGFRVPTKGIEQAQADSWRRISNFHFAFDFHSPSFTRDMTPLIWDRIICPSGVKKQFYGRRAIETFTIGCKENLEVQVYNKGQEITDRSGKLWMFDVWKSNGYEVPADNKAVNVWRLEVRFAKKFLRSRNILTAEQAFECLAELIGEALFTRRLVDEVGTDQNRWRWPMHPLWAQAYAESGEPTHMLERGRFVNSSGDALKRQLAANIIGNLRNINVLTTGSDDVDDWALIVEALKEQAFADPDHGLKVERTRERYKHLVVVENRK